MAPPAAAFSIESSEQPAELTLSGRFLAEDAAAIEAQLRARWPTGIPAAGLRWDLGAVKSMDTAIALLLWSAWGGARPAELELPPTARSIFERIARLSAEELDYRPRRPRDRGGVPGDGPLTTARNVVTVLGRFVLDLLQVLVHPSRLPWRELSAACYRASVTALPIVCIVGVLIGIVLSYLSSLQLREYGAESFLPMILGIGVVRELGPMLAAIVIAGRSGSSIAAGLAAMRLTQELDALSALGISHSLRLVLPRTLGLALTLPLLVVCTDIAALAGGMVSGWIELDLAPRSFLRGLAQDVHIGHFLIGLGKSLVFGLTIGLIACQYGLAAGSNTQSLSNATTRSVVLSISCIILLDAVFAVAFKELP